MVSPYEMIKWSKLLNMDMELKHCHIVAGRPPGTSLFSRPVLNDKVILQMQVIYVQANLQMGLYKGSLYPSKARFAKETEDIKPAIATWDRSERSTWWREWSLGTLVAVVRLISHMCLFKVLFHPIWGLTKNTYWMNNAFCIPLVSLDKFAVSNYFTIMFCHQKASLNHRNRYENHAPSQWLFLLQQTAGWLTPTYRKHLNPKGLYSLWCTVLVDVRFLSR